ncbi:MAG: hypothetical protein B6244_07700 [Candidatus Cloacimonetes bacterium 4572_55]|nr:MAG: hypothetical protein B6244_07700 [Candidatus Cloacimonetes bacterium 4572_55]
MEYDVLAIDDEQVILDSARKILSLNDLSVDIALDAESALKKIETETYKIILTDLMLPHISGFELIEIVKKQYPKLPIIMMTGYATLDNAVRSLKIGAFDFVPKPFDIDELLSVSARSLRYRLSIDDDNLAEQWAKCLSKKIRAESLYFLGNHSWARLEPDGTAAIGVGETFSRTVGEIEKIEFPRIGDDVFQGSACVKIFTEYELAHTVWSPLSGEVIDYNRNLEEDGYLISIDPFFEGRLFRIIPHDLENELENLIIS